MFHTYIANISAVLDVRCKCFYLDVVKVDPKKLKVAGKLKVAKAMPRSDESWCEVMRHDLMWCGVG